ncbi:hypothetical protein FNV43_RR03583 [Rhamnella rubrinervis]|uniref:Hexosyltransferase n=1 Tax=Rhamnella rubrinervis TaxID=2594499 RepID=A0A8K0HI87_9ROSA|nr:hypothetical protein FNV43_RR03583 [Rhamnella rubrinervis]
MAPEIISNGNVTSGLTKTLSGPSRAYVTFLAGNGNYLKGVNQTQFAMAYYVINYSKLRLWEFVEYSKMVYLDGDIQYKIGYCQQCPQKVRWPSDFGPKPALYFNAGMFVFEPSLPTYHDLLKTVKVTPPTSFAEQDFLNMYFRDKYKPIPPIYNLVGSKPWRFTGKEENMQREDIQVLVKKWWDIYNDESLDYKNTVNANEETDQKEMSLQQFLAALKEVGDVRYVTAPSAA